MYQKQAQFEFLESKYSAKIYSNHLINKNS